MYRFLTLVFSLLLLSGAATHAAPYPGHADLYVNDLADIIEPAAADQLRGELAKLTSETGVELTLLTIPSRGDYDDSPSIEAFATGVFNSWGVGRAEFNDGILVLIAVEDREMRIELGAGYDQGYDVLAQDIVNRWFLPEFKKNNIAAGIAAGMAQTITKIARPHAKGLPAEVSSAPLQSGFERFFPWAFGAIAAAIVGMGMFGQRLSDWSYRFRRCPSCGQKGLHREHVLPGSLPPSTGQILTTCNSCSYRDERPWRGSQNRNNAGGGGSFGGGSSSGGGASGRW